MKRVPIRVAIRTCQVALLTLLLLAACSSTDPDEEKDQVALIAQPAGDQPESDALGVVMVVQAKGGDRLRVRTTAGMHRRTVDEKLVPTSCITLPKSELTTLYFTVLPDDGESLLFVDLVDSTKPGDPPVDADTLLETCPGKTLLGRIVAVRHPVQEPAEDAGEASNGETSLDAGDVVTTESSTGDSGDGPGGDATLSDTGAGQ